MEAGVKMATSLSLDEFCWRPFFLAASNCLRASSRALANSADFVERLGVLGFDLETFLELELRALTSDTGWKIRNKKIMLSSIIIYFHKSLFIYSFLFF